MQSPQRQSENIERLKDLLSNSNNNLSNPPPRRSLSANHTDPYAFFQSTGLTQSSEESSESYRLQKSYNSTPFYKSHIGDAPRQSSGSESFSQFSQSEPSISQHIGIKSSLPSFQVQLSERQLLIEKIDSHQGSISEIRNILNSQQQMLNDIQQSCSSTNSLISTKDFDTSQPKMEDCLSELYSLKKLMQVHSKNSDDRISIRENEINQKIEGMNQTILSSQNMNASLSKSFIEIQNRIEAFVDSHSQAEETKKSISEIATKLDEIKRKIETKSEVVQIPFQNAVDHLPNKPTKKKRIDLREEKAKKIINVNLITPSSISSKSSSKSDKSNASLINNYNCNNNNNNNNFTPKLRTVTPKSILVRPMKSVDPFAHQEKTLKKRKRDSPILDDKKFSMLWSKSNMEKAPDRKVNQPSNKKNSPLLITNQDESFLLFQSAIVNKFLKRKKLNPSSNPSSSSSSNPSSHRFQIK